MLPAPPLRRKLCGQGIPLLRCFMNANCRCICISFSWLGGHRRTGWSVGMHIVYEELKSMQPSLLHSRAFSLPRLPRTLPLTKCCSLLFLCSPVHCLPRSQHVQPDGCGEFAFISLSHQHVRSVFSDK